jgi:cell division protein FtsB
MNTQQYLAMKQEIAVSTAYMHALAAQIDRLTARITELEDRRNNYPKREPIAQSASPVR